MEGGGRFILNRKVGACAITTAFEIGRRVFDRKRESLRLNCYLTETQRYFRTIAFLGQVTVDCMMKLVADVTLHFAKRDVWAIMTIVLARLILFNTLN